MIVERVCKKCQSSFEVKQKYANRGQGIFCSRSCSIAYRHANKPKPISNTVCAYCKSSFYLNGSQQKKSKSGVFFCCRAHKNLGQKLESNIPQIHLPLYGTGNGRKTYRKLAIEYYGGQCQNCKWDLFPAILEVNHKDINRDNNSIENLEVLCSRCHDIFHWVTSTGTWHKSEKPLTLEEANKVFYRNLAEYFS